MPSCRLREEGGPPWYKIVVSNINKRENKLYFKNKLVGVVEGQV